MTTELNEARRLVRTYLATSGFNLSITNDRGEKNVVIALATESLSTLHERITRSGGFATVFVVDGRELTVLSVVEPSSALHTTEDVIPSPNDGEATVGLFVDYLRSKNGPAILHIVEGNDSIEVEEQTTISV